MMIGALAIKHVMNYYQSTVCGKTFEWEDIGNISPNIHKYSEFTEYLTLSLPKFSLPSTSSVGIRQNFTPPKFSHICMALIRHSVKLLTSKCFKCSY